MDVIVPAEYYDDADVIPNFDESVNNGVLSVSSVPYGVTS